MGCGGSKEVKTATSSPSRAAEAFARDAQNPTHKEDYVQPIQQIENVDLQNKSPNTEMENYPRQPTQNLQTSAYQKQPAPVLDNRSQLGFDPYQQRPEPEKSPFKSNSPYESASRSRTPVVEERAQGSTGEETKPIIPRREEPKPPQIFFSFDFEAKTFNYYNFKSKQWETNDLGRSTEDCPKCPLFKFKVKGEEQEALQLARYMSYIALSNEVIFIIGGYNSYYSCLEYNISSNKFFAREPIKAFRNNPSLCRHDKYIYAVSGDLLDKFSTDVARYDTQRNEWTTLPDLPAPQGFASVAVINGAKGVPPSEKTLKLMALGGLSLKFPKTYTTVLSLYSFFEQKWTSVDLSRIVAEKVPKFTHCPLVQTKEGNIIILGTEGSRSVYNFDIFDMRLSTAGRLPNDEWFNESMKSKEAFVEDGKIICLAYKHRMKMYRGDLATNKWEVI